MCNVSDAYEEAGWTGSSPAVLALGPASQRLPRFVPFEGLGYRHENNHNSTCGLLINGNSLKEPSKQMKSPRSSTFPKCSRCSTNTCFQNRSAFWLSKDSEHIKELLKIMIQFIDKSYQLIIF